MGSMTRSPEGAMITEPMPFQLAMAVVKPICSGVTVMSTPYEAPAWKLPSAVKL